MILAAIVACEIGFWVVLAAGLGARYVLGRRRLGLALLAAVPLVDVALLAFTVVDLRRGAEPSFAHGLAAVYLGVSVVFGHSMIRWADALVARRWAGGPPPAPKPRGGTWASARREWVEFGRACLAALVAATFLLGAIALVGSAGDTSALAGWFPRMGTVLAVWLVGWPVVETVRAASGTPRVDA
jgi:hypothetical protein